MGVALTKTVFRRLVGAYLLLLPAAGVIVWIELTDTNWSTFDERFNELVDQHFGAPIAEDASAIVFTALVVVNLVAAFGLLKFRSWAKPTFFWPIVLLLVCDAAIGEAASYTSGWVYMVTFVDAALFGAISLLLYSREHGGVWLGRSHTESTGTL